MSTFKKLQRVLEKARKPLEKFVALEDLAEYCLSQGNYEEALHYYEMELEAAIDLHNEEKIAKSHRMIGEALVELAEYDKALQHTDKYYAWACANDKRLVEEQRALTTLGRTNLIKADSMKNKDDPQCLKAYTLAMKSLWKSLKLCEKLENEKMLSSSEINDMRARSLLNLGLTHEGIKEYDNAAKQYDMAIRLCRKHNIDGTLRNSCISYASLLIRQKKFDYAFQLYREAFASLKSIGDSNKQARQGADILFAESEGHMWKGDIHSARKALQKAYTMLKKIGAHEGSPHITDRLKLLLGMDLLQSKLLNLNMPPDELSRTYEALGDGFSSLGMFSFALRNYEKMLEHGKVAELNLTACYVSLAQTCKDLNEYEKAISYFEQELEYCSSAKEICSTLLAIYECQEYLKVPPSEQLNTLNRAYKIADSPKLRKRILEELCKMHELAGHQDAAADTRDKLNCLGDLSSDTDGGDEEEQTPNIGDLVDLESLSDESGDEEEGFNLESTFQSVASTSKRQSYRNKPLRDRRNEKGETRLHIACEKGNVKAVKMLLEQGFDINATDNVGWTPLHEACNHGFVDVIELLLEYGADVNGTGGPETGGITPLYDASQAGNFDVIEYLLDHNASVAVLTDQGESALDALNAFYERSQGTLTEEEERQYSFISDRLKANLTKVGLPVKSNRNNSKSCESQSSTIQLSPRNTSKSLRRLVNDDTDLDPLPHRKRWMRGISPVMSTSTGSCDEQEVDEGQQGVSEYINAMQCLRKNTDTLSSGEPKRRKSPQPLLHESEIVEDWLEDDVGKQPSKRRRKSDHLKSSLSSHSYKPLSVKKKSASRLSLNSCSSSRPSSVCSTDGRDEKRWSAGSRNSDSLDMSFKGVQETDIQSEGDRDVFEDSWSANPCPQESWPDERLPNPNNTRQASLLNFGVTKQYQNSQMVPLALSNQSLTQTSASSCINVRVEDHRLAIFVQNPSASIGWLAEEAARRFKKLEGFLPVLSIYSQDGALCSDEDPVQFVLGQDVEGRVQSWSDSSIADRYKEACQSLSADVKNDIITFLEESQVTHSLDIKETVYPTHIFKPVFRAISMERNLSRINLPSNSLQDKGVTDLCNYLPKLLNLRELDLSGNDLTAVAVGELSAAAKQGFLKVLQRLNLSHNNLGDSCFPYLVDITASASLQHLYLADCMLTYRIGEKCDEFLNLKEVECLDLSYNQLCTKGLARFLGFGDHIEARRLNPERLKSIFLIGVEGERLCQELILFLEQGNSIALRELHFSFGTMKDDELMQLSSYLRSAPELHTIRILSARNVKSRTICQLLMQQPYLKKLEIHNSKAIWNDEPNIVASITYAVKNVLRELCLRDLPNSAITAWLSLKGSSAVVRGSTFGLQVLSSDY